MSLRARTALWTLVAALLTSATLTASFAQQTSSERMARLRAEGHRVALSAITLYDVLRLTGSDADKATLLAFLNAAVRGNKNESELAYAVVVDKDGNVVAGAVNESITGKIEPRAVILGTPPSMLVIDATVIARDTQHATPGTGAGAARTADVSSGHVVVGLSTKPAQAALARTVAVAGGLSALVALLAALAVFIVVTRRAVLPMTAVLDGMRAVKGGSFDTVLPQPGGTDEGARLVDGFNDLVGALAERAKLQSTLERHVGKKLASEVGDRVVGEGRRVTVTALFLDVEGFTARVSRDPPETVVAMLHELVGACVEVIERHDGHVERLTGDTLIALWGVPEPRADDAHRAVACALELHERCKQLSDERRARREEGFTVGVGVATGDAVRATVGSKDRAESVVVGEPVSLARRIEEEAKATNFGVLVSETTFQAVSKHYEGAATPPVLVRGWGIPLILYRVRPRRSP